MQNEPKAVLELSEVMEYIQSLKTSKEQLQERLDANTKTTLFKLLPDLESINPSLLKQVSFSMCSYTNEFMISTAGWIGTIEEFKIKFRYQGLNFSGEKKKIYTSFSELEKDCEFLGFKIKDDFSSTQCEFFCQESGKRLYFVPWLTGYVHQNGVEVKQFNCNRMTLEEIVQQFHTT